MKIKKFSIGGYNDSISSYMAQQYPNLASPTLNWFQQSLMRKAPNVFANKNFSTNLVSPASQFKYPGTQIGVNTSNLDLKINQPFSSVRPQTPAGIISQSNVTAPVVPLAQSSNSNIINPQLVQPTKGAPLKNGNFKISTENIGQVAGIGSASLGPTNNDPTTQLVNSGYDMLSDVAMGINPVVGAIMKGADFLQSGLNKLTRGYTTVENSHSGFSKFLAGIPILGLTDAIGKTSIAGSDADFAKTVNYGYTPEEVDKRQFGNWEKLFKGKKAVTEARNRVQNVNEQNIKKSSILNINNRLQQAAQNSYGNVVERNLQQLMGGFGIDQLRAIAAKNGTKLYKLGNIKNQVKNKKAKTKKLQNGGTINVIPEGAFHSRKNNIDLDGITPKGIPVITFGDGGDVIQHAEIERAELIFRKELTDKIEEAYKKYKDGDESMLLEVGKLLTYEILENTDDRVGLLETVV